MKYDLPKYWYIIWSINGLLVAGLFGFYQNVIVIEEAKAETLRRDLALYEESRRLLKERDELFAAWQEYQERIDNFFFIKERLVAWLEFLEKKARAHSVVLDVSSLDEDSASAPYLRVTLRGTLADTIQFLHAVETGPYGIGVAEAAMRQGSLFEERITQLTFVLYYEDSTR